MHDFEDSDTYEELHHSPPHLQQQYHGNQLLTHGQQQQLQQQVHQIHASPMEHLEQHQQHDPMHIHSAEGHHYEQQPQQHELSNGGFDVGGHEMGGAEGEEEEESVYIKDNVVMRRIQIEGEDQEYLMDPEGNIYDMQGNFIGTANANELEEMEEEGNHEEH